MENFNRHWSQITELQISNQNIFEVFFMEEKSDSIHLVKDTSS